MFFFPILLTLFIVSNKVLSSYNLNSATISPFSPLMKIPIKYCLSNPFIIPTYFSNYITNLWTTWYCFSANKDSKEFSMNVDWSLYVGASLNPSHIGSGLQVSHRWNNPKASSSRVTITTSIFSSFITPCILKCLSNLDTHLNASFPSKTRI